MYYEGRCKICKSVNRLYYEQLRQDGVFLKDIMKKALEKGEKFHYVTVQKHFTVHWLNPIKEKVKRQTDEIVEAKRKDLVDVYNELYNNLNRMKNLPAQLLEAKGVTERSISAMTGLMAEMRKTLVECNKLSEKLNLRPSKSASEIMLDVIEAIKTAPIDKESLKRMIVHLQRYVMIDDN